MLAQVRCSEAETLSGRRCWEEDNDYLYLLIKQSSFLDALGLSEVLFLIEICISVFSLL